MKIDYTPNIVGVLHTGFERESQNLVVATNSHLDALLIDQGLRNRYASFYVDDPLLLVTRLSSQNTQHPTAPDQVRNIEQPAYVAGSVNAVLMIPVNDTLDADEIHYFWSSAYDIGIQMRSFFY